MFTMAIMGNLTYGTSLLLRPLTMDYFVSRLPWLVLFCPPPPLPPLLSSHPTTALASFLKSVRSKRHLLLQVGSLCVCFFDMCILLQFLKYGAAKPLPNV
jgi:hypothetical protein